MSQSEALYAPRIQLVAHNGLPGKDFILPSLDSVREQALIARDIRKNPGPYSKHRIISIDGLREIRNPPLPVIWSCSVPLLIKFSVYVNTMDVPEDVMEDCIWALSVFIQIMEQASESILKDTGNMHLNEDYLVRKRVSLINARCKIVVHLIHVGRPSEAVVHAKALISDECETQGDEPWLTNPVAFQLYGEALVLSRRDDDEAVKTLRRALSGFEALSATSGGLIETRVFLSRALRNVGADSKAREHEAWLIDWFRKNPGVFLESRLRYLLLPEGPILEALGGPTWFSKRTGNAQKDQRRVKKCRKCGAREPATTLTRCASCQHIYYCGKACQKADWKDHRVLCRDMAAEREKVEKMKEINPESAKRAADWLEWRQGNHYATHEGIINALNLPREPGRGRTHIVFLEVQYVPTATKLRHKFHIASCGVFLIQDVLRDVETILGLESGEGQEWIDDILKTSERTPQTLLDAKQIPYVTLSFGRDLNSMIWGASINVDGLREHKYDPRWRKRLNAASSPGPAPMVLRSGVQDVENVF
ncbi:hypothetical protein C8R44DRAFT_783580 [Mycena epipterygia]|nr:hypothetical protein C8R44DRAFT_783580 [Mycena epipterygia]